MKGPIASITMKEFKGYFVAPIAYVYLFTFILIVSWIFFRGFFLIGEASLRPLFGLMPWIYLFFVPAIAMGKWAEERKGGTIELLMTYPIRLWQVVLSKFLAGLGLVIVALLLTLPILITVVLLGPVDWGPVIGGYLGLALLGGAYLSISLWISSITDNQIIAFIGGVVVCFALFMIGEPLITLGLPAGPAAFFQYLGLGNHFDSIGRGVIDSRDILYYFSVIGLFLFLNLKSLEGRS